MLRVYGDESYDEKAVRVCAVAGLLGAPEDWATVEAKWLETTNGRPFHATEWETEFVNDPDRSKHRQNLKTYAKLAKVLADSNLMGFGAVMDLQGWRVQIPASDNLAHSAYYRCFSEVVIYFGRIARLSIPPTKVEFVFDRNLECEVTAHELYAVMAKSTDWLAGEWLAEKISSATIATPGIQMADLLSRESMKYLDNQIGPTKRRIRASLEAMMSAKRFRIEVYSPEHSQNIVNAIRGNEALSEMSAQNYQKWLQRKRTTDTMRNRVRFLNDQQPRAKG